MLISTMIQEGEVRRYKEGDKVPWWIAIRYPTFTGWPKFGVMRFGTDVEVMMEPNSGIITVSGAPGPGGYIIYIRNAANMRFYFSPGRGEVHIVTIPHNAGAAAIGQFYERTIRS